MSVKKSSVVDILHVPTNTFRLPMFDGRGRWVEDLETLLAREHALVSTHETGPIGVPHWASMFREDRDGQR